SPLKQFPSRCWRRPEPYGVVLLMSPWNYPFQLTVAPLVGALAAGNCAVVKPSAYSPATSAIIARMIRECFDEQYVAAVEGGRQENQALLHQKFDYIFFTGSVAVGKTVMAAAAENLTPVTLELGGKSPCLVDETADIKMAAKRIAWGKFLNAGQTCVAPDYVFVHSKVKAALLAELAKCVKMFYGDDPLVCEDYPKMINDKHFDRVMGLTQGEQIHIGGQSDKERLKIAPTVLDNVNFDSPVMGEEIFGPVLPVIAFDDLKEAVNEINRRPKPLALYVFTSNKQNENFVLNNVRFGGGCVNDTVVHLATSHMPFGGVGESGTGGYHGRASFDTFTHYKSILKKSRRIDLPLRYPPYKEGFLKLLKKM
ncbi:MAG: aldehyde dehydrogenase family protein, partial [Oscillospiraceae bacterium]|nr:aldehyde dehydrogenase family protein [Oscillospiraceae bacterium]